MTALFEQIKHHFESLSSREQWLVALAGWIGILGLGFNLYLSPQGETMKQISYQQVENLRKKQDVLIENQKKKETLNVSADLELEAQLLVLQMDAQIIDDLLASKVAGLVSASDMAALMESVLKKTGRLTLQSMVSFPAIQLALTEDKRYYIHPVELTLKGGYFDIVNYLVSLEALSIKYYWRSVDYNVIRYPLAEVKINVYTLGESPVFIGGASDFAE